MNRYLYFNTNPSYNQYAAKTYRGNMNTSTIRTTKARTIMLQHDVSSLRPYSRIHLVSGTKAAALKYPLPGKNATSHEGWLDEAEYKVLEEKYAPEIVKRMSGIAKQIGGHGSVGLIENVLKLCISINFPILQQLLYLQIIIKMYPSNFGIRNYPIAF